MGVVIAGATAKGICRLQFSDVLRDSAEFTLSGENIAPESVWHLEQVGSELQEYFEGTRKRFTVQVDLAGTEFQLRVWNELIKIPFGSTLNYQQLAKRLGDPHATRAVAAANARNPVLILVPCHRVIAADGTLAGFSGGLWRKRDLLDLESGVQAISFS
jgi:O-6-methylguanine DNA methyltransferase